MVAPCAHAVGCLALYAAAFLKRQTQEKVTTTAGTLFTEVSALLFQINKYIEKGLERATGRKKGGAHSHAGMGEWGREKKKERKKASLAVQWSLGSGHPELYLAQLGSSMIIEQTSQQRTRLPPAPRGKIYIPIFT